MALGWHPTEDLQQHYEHHLPQPCSAIVTLRVEEDRTYNLSCNGKAVELHQAWGFPAQLSHETVHCLCRLVRNFNICLGAPRNGQSIQSQSRFQLKLFKVFSV